MKEPVDRVGDQPLDQPLSRRGFFKYALLGFSGLATAFGVLTQIQNIGLFAFPKTNGWLRETTGSYSASQIMFAGLGVLALVFAVLLLRSDRRTGRVLERP